MTYRDLLLPLVSYPDSTPQSALQAGVALASRVGGDLTALCLHVRIPALRNRVANALIGMDEMAAEEENRSAEGAADLAEQFKSAAAKAGVTASVVLRRTPLQLQADSVRDHARTRDLCLAPIGPAVLADRAVAEAVLFGSGRPVLVFAEDAPATPGDGFGTVAIAWDGGARAARAVADALPALRRAREVRVLVVTDEKPDTRADAADDLLRHLNQHGVAAELDEVPAAGEPIGQVLRQYVRRRGIELLVMGGFGHSRTREFVLGGATSSMLEAPPCPVLISH